MQHVPNLLSLLRIALTPYLFLLMARHQFRALLPWFIAIALTDVIDGWIARRFQASSKLGAILDPLADKFLLSGTFLTLAWTAAIPAWLAVVVLGRDALILLAAAVLYLTGSRRTFPPSVWGKLSTFVQVLFVCFQIGLLSGIQVAPVALALQWLTVFFAFASLLDYARRAIARGRTPR